MILGGAAAGLLLLAFALVMGFGPWVVRFCRAQGLVAEIDARRAHRVPTPHGGGILVVAVGVGLGIAAVWGLQLPNEPFLTAMLVASLAVAGVGWLDDKHDLEARTRLLVHLAAVGVGVILLPQIFDFVPLWLEKLVLMLAWGWFLNLYNFMDGADGQTSVEGIFIALALCLLVPALSPLAAIVAGALLGFLRLNWAPARVFIGDVGATWLGYVLGGLLLLALVDDTWRMVYPLATATLYFCLDATWTLVRRVAGGHKPWEPHKEFWFHRALALGLNHRQLACRVVLLNTALLGVALTGYALDGGGWTLVAGLALLMAVGLRIRWGEARGAKTMSVKMASGKRGGKGKNG